MKDYFKVLGLNRNSTQKEIDDAYRKLVIKHHPDKNPDDSNSINKFKEIQEAYEHLKSQKPNFSFNTKNSIDEIFDNVFSKIFGDQKNSKLRLSITLEESYRGCEKQIEVDSHDFCTDCQGTGGKTWISCGKCYGKGFVFDKDSGLLNSSCVFCDGKGNIIKEKCDVCKGNGFIIKQKKKITVEIPAGIKNETQIRLSGEGSGGGDLYVVINIIKNPKFERKDNDLFANLEVPYHILVLGGELDFNIFSEKIKVKVKSRTKTGSKIIVSKLGFCSLENQNSRGDLILMVQLKFPDKINKEHKQTIEKLKSFENL